MVTHIKEAIENLQPGINPELLIYVIPLVFGFMDTRILYTLYVDIYDKKYKKLKDIIDEVYDEFIVKHRGTTDINITPFDTELLLSKTEEEDVKQILMNRLNNVIYIITDIGECDVWDSILEIYGFIMLNLNLILLDDLEREEYLKHLIRYYIAEIYIEKWGFKIEKNLQQEVYIYFENKLKLNMSFHEMIQWFEFCMILIPPESPLPPASVHSDSEAVYGSDDDELIQLRKELSKI